MRRRCLPESPPEPVPPLAGPEPLWEVKRLSGTVRELHELSASALAGPAVRAVHLCQPLRPALVLGSTQHLEVADQEACARGGLDVVKRRSGGGAVLVEPGRLVWADVVVPAGDPLWRDDVGEATWWLGDAWAAAIGGAAAWKGPMLRRPWSALVCFAGLGPGEVTLPGGAKVVGISQRRNRYGALFQCSCLLEWRAAELLSLLALPEEDRERAAAELQSVAAGVAGQLTEEDVVARFLAAVFSERP